MTRLLAVALFVPLLDLYLLVKLAHLTSAGSVLLYLLLAAMAGGRLIARPGLSAMFPFRKTGQSSTAFFLSDRLLEIAAGLLLILPGVLSDLLAIALLVRPLRVLLMRGAAQLLSGGVVARANMWQTASAQRRRTTEPDDPIDVPSRRIQ